MPDDPTIHRHPGHPDALTPGEAVLGVDRKDRRYLVTLVAEERFHFHGGYIDHDRIIGSPEGSELPSSKGVMVRFMRPTAADWTLKAPRGAQVIYPKDQAMIVALADIAPGARVVEAGAGSGALTAALLRAVGPEGHVTSFELRDDHAAVARANVARRMGDVTGRWDLVVDDVVTGLAEVSCDRVILDLLEPWAVVPGAAEALHPGGILCTYTPTVLQVHRVHEALERDERWGLAKTVETLVRGWHVEGLSVRPDHRMVAHTAFITTARRLPPPQVRGERTM